MTYEVRLKKLNLSTLQCKRFSRNMIETYNILTGKYYRTVTNLCPINITILQVFQHKALV